jgi:mutual gliding-motility protein MglA
MASLNPLTREVVFKIVFYGPGLGGKTTTLQHIHAASDPDHRGKMVSLATPMDRTLYFDFLPLRMPLLHGMHVRLQLFTVPGQVYYGATRKLVLTGADGVVFVADSQAARLDANLESLEDLGVNLAEHHRALTSIPHTFHWNKRDIPDVLPVADLERALNPGGAPSHETIATRGDGVFEGLERIAKLVFAAYQADLPRNDAEPVREVVEESTITDALLGLAEAPRRTRTPPDGVQKGPVSGPTPSSLESIPNPIPRRPSWTNEAGGPAPSSNTRTQSSTNHRAMTPPPSAVEAVSATAKSPTPPPPRAEPLVQSAPIARVALVQQNAAHAGAPSGAAPGSQPETLDAPAVPAQPAAAPFPAPVSRTRMPAVSQPSQPSGDGSRMPAVAQGGAAAAARGSAMPQTLARPEVVTAPPPSRNSSQGHAFSLVSLWSEADRDAARQLETAAGNGDAATAVLVADVLVTRVLASAVGGNADAPRDPALVVSLLGIDGRRYLAFRATVRAARTRQSVTLNDALEAYAFAVEIRRIQASLH